MKIYRFFSFISRRNHNPYPLFHFFQSIFLHLFFYFTFLSNYYLQFCKKRLKRARKRCYFRKKTSPRSGACQILKCRKKPLLHHLQKRFLVKIYVISDQEFPETSTPFSNSEYGEIGTPFAVVISKNRLPLLTYPVSPGMPIISFFVTVFPTVIPSRTSLK